MKRKKSPWDIMLVAALAAVAGVGLQSQQFAIAQEQEGLEGPIVQIGPEKSGEATAPVAAEAPAAPQEPSYWIGLRGRGVEDPVLRTQLQLAEDMGVVIEDIVPDSPAEKAGLRKHDIILRANDDVVDSMETLQQHVQTGHDKSIELKLLRLGKEIDITVTPETRPANFEQQLGAEGMVPGQEMLGGDLGRLLQQFQGGAGLPGGMRVIGPGMVLGNRQFDVNAVPNGISVSIARSGDGPAQITVKKGDQTWTVNSDDAKALEELPEDVRAYVSGMLNGQGGIQAGNLDLNAQLRHMLPDHLGDVPGMGNFKAQEDELAKRMQQLEKQIEELQNRLESEAAAEAEQEAAH
jgi:membrane-associated protease RseP (regulator of RpoE activity)